MQKKQYGTCLAGLLLHLKTTDSVNTLSFWQDQSHFFLIQYGTASIFFFFLPFQIKRLCSSSICSPPIKRNPSVHTIYLNPMCKVEHNRANLWVFGFPFTDNNHIASSHPLIGWQRTNSLVFVFLNNTEIWFACGSPGVNLLFDSAYRCLAVVLWPSLCWVVVPMACSSPSTLPLALLPPWASWCVARYQVNKVFY